MKTFLARISNYLQRLADFLFGYDFFISYSHQDGMGYPAILAERLEAHNFRVFLDTKEYVAGTDLQMATKRRIRMSKKLVVVVRNHAIESEWVRKEVKAFLDRGNIPIAIDINRVLDSASKGQPLKQLLWDKIYILESIRGEEERPSEDVLKELVRSFRSTRQETLRLRLMTGAAVVFLLVAILAVWQAWIAEKRRKNAVSRQLATQARYQIDSLLDSALLLSAAANRSSLTFESRDVLLQTLQYSPRLVYFLHTGQTPWRAVDLSNDAKSLVTAGADGTIMIWNRAGSRLSAKPLGRNKAPVSAVALSPNGEQVVVGGEDGYVYFWDVETGSLLGRSEERHQERVASITFSPAGDHLVSGSAWTQVFLWDVLSRKRLHQLQGHKSTVYAVAFSPDGRTVVTGAENGIIFFWDVKDGKRSAEIRSEEPGFVYSLTFSPNGELLAGAGESGRIRFWRTDTKRGYGKVLKAHKSSIRKITFHPAGNTLASGDEEGEIFFWNLQHMDPVAEPLHGHSQIVTGISFDTAEDRLFSAGHDPYILVWDIGDRPMVIGSLLAEPPGPLDGLVFNSNGKILASLGCASPGIGICKDYAIRLWSIEDGIMLGEPMPVPPGKPISLAFTNSPARLAMIDKDGTITFLDTDKQRVVRTIKPPHLTDRPAKAPQTGGPESEGKLMSDSPEHLDLKIFNIFDLKRLFNIVDEVVTGSALEQLSVIKAAFSHDAEALGTINETLTDCTLEQLSVIKAAFSHDTGTLAVGSGQGCIFIWNQRHGWRVMSTRVHKDAITALALSKDGEWLASADRTGAMVLWDLKSLNLVIRWELGSNTKVNAIAFAPDSRTLAVGASTVVYSDTKKFFDTGTESGQLFFIDLNASGLQLDGPHAVPGAVYSVAYSEKGDLLAIGGCEVMGPLSCLNGYVALQDVQTGQWLGKSFRAHHSNVTSLAFSPNGKQLASATRNAQIMATNVEIILWDLLPENWIRLACSLANRGLTIEEKIRFLGDDRAEQPCTGL